MKKKSSGWGGRRRGAGRKRGDGRRRVAHRARARVGELTAFHVTVRVVPGLPSLRTIKFARVFGAALAAVKRRSDFRVVEFAVMSNHIHAIVEADDSEALSRGMRSLLTRSAVHLNRAILRRGRVFADRFHARAITSPLDAWRTLHYVLCNARRHGIRLSSLLDPFSSAPWFPKWQHAPAAPARPSPVSPARSSSLRDACTWHGRLDARRAPFSWAREP